MADHGSLEVWTDALPGEPMRLATVAMDADVRPSVLLLAAGIIMEPLDKDEGA